MSEYHTISIEARGLLPIKRNLLKNDIAYFEASLKHDVWEQLDNLKKNRGFKANLINLLSKTKLGKASIDNILANLEMLETLGDDLLKVTYQEKNGIATISFRFSKMYFEIWATTRKYLPVARLDPMTTKDGIREKLEASIRKTYTRDYTVSIEGE